MTFDFAYAVEYDFDLDYNDLSNIADAVARAADATTGGDREVWDLSFQRNEVSVSFPCECCRDRFIANYETAAQAEQTDDASVPSIKRTRGRSRPACR